MKRFVCYLFALVLSISVFAERYSYSVASYGNYDFFGKKITIAPLYSDQNADDQEFIYFSQFVASYLLLYGAEFLLKEGDVPDVVILFGYGVDKGEKRVESDPIYATYMTPYVGYWGNWYGYGGYHSEVVGYNKYEVQEYNKYINLVAYSAPKDTSKLKDKTAWKQAWKMDISMTDECREFNSAIPYILHSVFPYLGRTIQTNESVAANASMDENFLFNKVKSGSFCAAPLVTSWPQVDSISKGVERKGMHLIACEFFENKTIFTFYSEKGGYKISEDIYLLVNGQQYKAIGADGIELGRNSNARMFSIIFPTYPGLYSCDIMDPTYQFYHVVKKSTKETRPIYQ